MKVGDIVRIKPGVGHKANSKIGVIVALAKRLHIPAAKVMVLGEISEFDECELEKVNETF